MKFNHQGLNYILIAVSILLTASCSNADKRRLADSVEATAKSCPIRYGEGISIDTVIYARDTVFYHTRVNTPLIRLDVLSDHEDLIIPALADMVSKTDSKTVVSDLELCRNAGAIIRFELTDGSSAMNVDIDPATVLARRKNGTQKQEQPK